MIAGGRCRTERQSNQHLQSPIINAEEPLGASSPGCHMDCRMAAAPPVQQEEAAVGHLSAALAACLAHVAVNG